MQMVAHFDYGGNWTAFYRTGAAVPLPPISAEENIFLIQGQGSGGYDGQYYRLIAQDPFLLHGTGKYIDGPRLRYRRILIPALAWLCAFASPTAVTYAYIPTVLAFLGLGAYWLSRYATLWSLSPWSGLAFLLTPAAFLSIDRLTVDIALAALTVAFALYWKSGHTWKLYIVLLFAPLAKETGVFLIAACCLGELFQRRWFRAVMMATSGIPAALWFLYVQFHTSIDGTAWIQLPFQSVLRAMLHPDLFPLRKWYIVPLDYLAWFGMILAILIAVPRWNKNNPLAMGAVFFAVLVAVIDFNVWEEVEAFGRAFTPLLILLILARPNLWSALPTLLLLPRALVFPLSETFNACKLLLR